jgi:hypothetical protein
MQGAILFGASFAARRPGGGPGRLHAGGRLQQLIEGRRRRRRARRPAAVRLPRFGRRHQAANLSPSRSG